MVVKDRYRSIVKSGPQLALLHEASTNTCAVPEFISDRGSGAVPSGVQRLPQATDIGSQGEPPYRWPGFGDTVEYT